MAAIRVPSDLSELTGTVAPGQMPPSGVAAGTYNRVTVDAAGRVTAGSAGVAGSSDLSYVHTQAVPSDTWAVTHNLGKRPSVTVVDSAETVVVGSVRYADDNTLTVTFSGGFSGKAYLN